MLKKLQKRQNNLKNLASILITIRPIMLKKLQKRQNNLKNLASIL